MKQITYLFKFNGLFKTIKLMADVYRNLSNRQRTRNEGRTRKNNNDNKYTHV